MSIAYLIKIQECSVFKDSFSIGANIGRKKKHSGHSICRHVSNEALNYFVVMLR